MTSVKQLIHFWRVTLSGPSTDVYYFNVLPESKAVYSKL